MTGACQCGQYAAVRRRGRNGQVRTETFPKRERQLGINVRVNQTEKRKLQMNARKRWLSLSAYLRKAGLEQELRELPTKEFETLYREIYYLQNRLDKLDKGMIKVVLDDVQTKLLDLYHGIER